MRGYLIGIVLWGSILFGVMQLAGDDTPPPGPPPTGTEEGWVRPADGSSLASDSAPDGKDTEIRFQQKSVEMALNEIIGHPEAPSADEEFDLKCDDIDAIRKTLKAGFSAISDLRNAKSEGKVTEEHRKEVVEVANKVFERLKEACDVIVNVQKNNGNNAIVLSREALNPQQNARLEILSVRFSEEYFKLFVGADSKLWPMLITDLE